MRIPWFDITTTNLPQSKDFYRKLFDWQFAPVPGTDQAAEIVAGGTPVGTRPAPSPALSDQVRTPARFASRPRPEPPERPAALSLPR